MTQPTVSIADAIATELHVKRSQVEAAIQLLDEGSTVPFIARYRKEITGGLDDTQLRLLAERLHYLRELETRREVVLQTIREQDKLTPELEEAILAAKTKTRLEDLYLPYRPRRRTKATLAKEAGLEPLAMALWKDQTLDPLAHAEQFIQPEKDTSGAVEALEGARQILMELFAEDANLLAELRQTLWDRGVLQSVASKDTKKAQNKFADYFEYAEAIKKIPSHRALALFRGRRENALRLSLSLTDDPGFGEERVAAYFGIQKNGHKASAWLLETVAIAWKTKLLGKLELELLTQLREAADEEAILVFAKNLRDLLLAAPAGKHVTLGLDPGIRTGIKVVVVDPTGKLLDYTAVFPFAPQNDWQGAIASLAKLVAKFSVTLISIGNGTASRETERLVSDMMKMYPDLPLTKIMVNEAGASVYSASELAAKEFPELDVTLRGAVSIARRLQDPLAELVKIDPKSIGVGQYQHDVNQARLAKSLEAVVEDCVNCVGVDANTASAALLTRVSGFNETLATNLVQFRDENGPFKDREQLKAIPRMGEKAFQQAAGFLRIMGGDNPLDSSSVHPEAYPLVEKILTSQKTTLEALIGNVTQLQSVNAESFVDDQFGLPTIRDVLQELEKPGRDPRPEFKTAQFKEGIETLDDLEIGMILEGVISNVTNFGAFVDIGVHQDGLVHISAMTDRFITDPHTLVKAGDIVMVRVVEVDKERRRIGLSMKLEDKPVRAAPPKAAPTQQKKSKPGNKVPKATHRDKPAPAKKSNVFNSVMADALAKLKTELKS